MTMRSAKKCTSAAITKSDLKIPQRSPLHGQCHKLLELSNHMLSLYSSEDILRQLLYSLGEALGCDSAVLFFFEQNDGKRLPRSIQVEFNAQSHQSWADPLRRELVEKVRRSGLPEMRNYAGNGDGATAMPLTNHLEHLIAVPVAVKNHNCGIFAASRKGESPYSKDEYELARLFASFASLTLENAGLAHDKEQIAMLLRKLSPLTDGLMRPLSLKELAEHIGNGALAVSGADRVAVYRLETNERFSLLYAHGLSSEYLNEALKYLHQLRAENMSDLLQPSFTSDVSHLPMVSIRRKLSKMAGYQAVAACPVQYEDRLLATIDCLYNRPREWSKADQDAMKIFAGQAALAFENARLRQDLEDTYMETILTLARAVDARDAYTAQHSQKLAEWAVVTAQKLGLSDNEVQTIRWAALLHDIGKIGIPDSILRKPGPLTDEEWVVMKRHPELGAQIVAPLRKLEKITPLIRHHQEKYDGSGYPAGLKGEQIPLGARILTVVDAYGAMTDDRVYRRARTQSEAVAELKRCAGQHFDRHIVDVFNQVIQATC